MKFVSALAAKLRGRPLALCDVNDVDGIASAALFKRKYPHGVVILAGPSDVKRWWVKLLTWDFVADLPCPGKARVRADHHKTNRPCAEREYYDPSAPASALLAAKALGLDGDEVARELVEAAIQTDTANIKDPQIRLLDLAIRYSPEREKLLAIDKLAQMGLKALETEPLSAMARRGLERDKLVHKIAEVLPAEKTLFIYSPVKLGISYRALVIELEKRGAVFVNILVRRGWRTYRLYCGAHRDGPYDCAELAARLGGGGHKYAAGALIKAPFYDVKRPLRILAEILKPAKIYALGRCEEYKDICQEVPVMTSGSIEQ